MSKKIHKLSFYHRVFGFTSSQLSSQYTFNLAFFYFFNSVIFMANHFLLAGVYFTSVVLTKKLLINIQSFLNCSSDHCNIDLIKVLKIKHKFYQYTKPTIKVYYIQPFKYNQKSYQVDWLVLQYLFEKFVFCVFCFKELFQYQNQMDQIIC